MLWLPGREGREDGAADQFELRYLRQQTGLLRQLGDVFDHDLLITLERVGHTGRFAGKRRPM